MHFDIDIQCLITIIAIIIVIIILMIVKPLKNSITSFCKPMKCSKKPGNQCVRVPVDKDIFKTRLSVFFFPGDICFAE